MYIHITYRLYITLEMYLVHWSDKVVFGYAEASRLLDASSISRCLWAKSDQADPWASNSSARQKWANPVFRKPLLGEGCGEMIHDWHHDRYPSLWILYIVWINSIMSESGSQTTSWSNNCKGSVFLSLLWLDHQCCFSCANLHLFSWTVTVSFGNHCLLVKSDLLVRSNGNGIL